MDLTPAPSWTSSGSGRRSAATPRPLSRAIIDGLVPSANAERLKLSLQQVDEARLLLAQGEPIPVRGLGDVATVIERARDANRGLEPSDLLAIASFLEASGELARLLRGQARGAGAAGARRRSSSTTSAPRDDHRKAIQSPGRGRRRRLAAAARDLRRECARIETAIRSVLDELIDSPKLRPVLQERSYSIRNGRFVIPVKLEMKGHVLGILHDKSASGSTAFIEPREVANLANDLADLRLDEAREVARILLELTKAVIAEEPRIRHTQNVAAWLDFTRARAAFSQEIDGVSPLVSADGAIRLRGARHPLLVLQAREGQLPQPVVPLSLELGRAFRMLVVTGPEHRAARRSRSRRSGSLQLMFQCGLHVPALEGSELPGARRRARGHRRRAEPPAEPEHVLGPHPPGRARARARGTRRRSCCSTSSAPGPIRSKARRSRARSSRSCSSAGASASSPRTSAR